jgi:DNA-binding response OmpR family regulator
VESDIAPSVLAAYPIAMPDGALAKTLQLEGLASEWIPTGRAALGWTPSIDAKLWLIRTKLPDMSGFELIEMLSDRLRHSVTCLVGDRYRVEEERRARCLGVSLYVGWPLNELWLRKLARQVSRTSGHAGRGRLAVGVGPFEVFVPDAWVMLGR